MGGQLTKHQLFEYPNEEPCIIYNMNISAEGIVNSHWHKELEIVYYLRGNTLHYIDGKCVRGFPGRVIVTNSECVHNILPEELPADDGKMDCVVLLIREEFLHKYFPEYQQLYFTNETEQAGQELVRTIMRLSEYAVAPIHTPQDHLYLNGMLLQLLFYLYNEGVQLRADVSGIRNANRLKGVLQYIGEHYADYISQKEVAEQFYINPSHLSRLFKQCMGITFTDYLTRYRLKYAHKDLLETSDNVIDIALHNGFGDSRSFINAFKKLYGQTPLQYRKNILGLK